MNRTHGIFRVLAGVALAAVVAMPLVADDLGTEIKVRKALLVKLGADALHIDVDMKGTEVLLGGTVKKRATSELAEDVAESVEGVTGVDNEIKLAEYEASGSQAGVAATETERELEDAAIEAKVRVALIDRLGSDGVRISTEVASGVVTLSYSNDFPAARKAEARAATEAVSGVKKVIELKK